MRLADTHYLCQVLKKEDTRMDPSQQRSLYLRSTSTVSLHERFSQVLMDQRAQSRSHTCVPNALQRKRGSGPPQTVRCPATSVPESRRDGTQYRSMHSCLLGSAPLWGGEAAPEEAGQRLDPPRADPSAVDSQTSRLLELQEQVQVEGPVQPHLEETKTDGSAGEERQGHHLQGACLLETRRSNQEAAGHAAGGVHVSFQDQAGPGAGRLHVHVPEPPGPAA